MGQLSQRSGLSGNAVLVTVALFRTLMSRKLLVKELRSLPHRVSLGLSGGGSGGGWAKIRSGAGQNPVAKGACFGPDFGPFG